jgi:hypothetical protein
MTELLRIHAIIDRLDDGVVLPPDPEAGLNITQVLCVVMDQVVPHLDLASVGMLARTCKSLRTMTTDVPLLDYLMRLLPAKNSEDTRRVFLVPRCVPLARISRGMYSQSHGLHSAIQKYGGMEAFREAVESRRRLTLKRRTMSYKRAVDALAQRARRAAMVSNAVTVLRLPPEAHYHPSARLFVNHVPPIAVEQEEVRLTFIMDRICWMHYLAMYTNFTDQLATRREVMGDYPGLANDVMQEFVRPGVWPWLA